MPMRIVLRVLQAVFIITALVLIIPTVTLVTEGMDSGGTANEQCTTTTGNGGTTQTCQVPVPGNKVEAGIAYALMSISAALGAVAMRPDSGIGRRLAGPQLTGPQQPVAPAGAPPFPPQGPQPPQAPQNRGW